MRSPQPIVLADMMLRLATKREVTIAALFIAAFVGLTIGSQQFGSVQGPVAPPFIPIAGTLWGAADLLTAFLLLTQFSVNGIRVFAFVGVAYCYSGVLTIPYIAFYPGLFFPAALPLAMQQVSLYLWLLWHLVFPLIVGGYSLYDPHFRRRFLTGERIRRGLQIGPALVIISAVTAAIAIVSLRGLLPIGIDQGGFTRLWHVGLAPAVFAINVAAAVAVVRSGKKLSLLQLWLGVALIMAALDGLLNAWSQARFTVAWYLGKAETLITAGIVLLMLLSEVGALYRSLGTMAIMDSLTGLRNRRSFDEYLHWSLGHRAKAGVAFLLLDIDFFKQFNDRYGHAAGDTCLRSVADCLRGSLWRSVDLVARYGGEEFVVLLPETSAAGGLDVAERIRKSVEGLEIEHADSTVSRFVTVSIGVAHASSPDAADGDRLFRLADAALYKAKSRRNVTVVAEDVFDGIPIAAGLRAKALD